MGNSKFSSGRNSRDKTLVSRSIRHQTTREFEMSRHHTKDDIGFSGQLSGHRERLNDWTKMKTIFQLALFHAIVKFRPWTCFQNLRHPEKKRFR